MEILRHVHVRKIGDFDEKVILLELKTSAVTATAFAFFRLTDNNELMASCEKGSNRFINHCDTDQQTLHDFDQLVHTKMLLEFSKFLYKLALSSAETGRATGVQLTRPGATGKTG